MRRCKAALALAEAQAEAARSGVRENEVRLDGSEADARATERGSSRTGCRRQAEVDAAQAEVDSFDARIVAAREQVRVAERQIELERTNLDNTIIRAPFSGVAISKDAQPGEMVSPVSAGGGFTRTGICTIVDMRSLEIEVDVNESYINRVKPGQDVTAVLDAYPDWQIPAHVITTVPTADRQKATVLVRIGFEQLDPRILPDMGVKVTFLRDARGGGRARVGATGHARAEGGDPDRRQPVLRLRRRQRRRRSPRREDRRRRRRSARSARRPQRRGERVVVSPPPGAGRAARRVAIR